MRKFVSGLVLLNIGLLAGLFVRDADAFHGKLDRREDPIWNRRVLLASRNASGTMSAINGPYISGTTTSSALVNARLADIEAEITDSKSRSGKGDFTAVVKGVDGTVAAPAYSFTSEPGSGWYRIGATDYGFAISGVKKLELTSSLFTVTPNATFSGTLGVTSDFAVATNKFTVAAASGNTVVAGTLDVTGRITGLSLRGTTTTLAANDTLSLVTGTNGFLFLDPTTNSSTSEIAFGFNTNKQAGALNLFHIYNNSADRTELLRVTSKGTGSGADGVMIAPLTIGASGTAISASYRATTSWTPGTVSANSCVTTAITVTGTISTAECAVHAPGLNTGVVLSCEVSSNDSCSVYLCNVTGGGIAGFTGTYSCRTFNP